MRDRLNGAEDVPELSTKDVRRVGDMFSTTSCRVAF